MHVKFAEHSRMLQVMQCCRTCDAVWAPSTRRYACSTSCSALSMPAAPQLLVATPCRAAAAAVSWLSICHRFLRPVCAIP